MLNVYEKLLELNKRYFTGREIGRILDVGAGSRRVVLTRLVKKGTLRRIWRNLYELKLRPADIREAANIIYRPSYLSFTYCLGELGILNQIAYAIEFATPRKTKTIVIRDRDVVFRKIKRELFFGYALKDNIFIAEPEKALLDTLYLKSKGLAGLSEEELNLGGLSRKRFLEMSGKFPARVRKEARRLAKNMR